MVDHPVVADRHCTRWSIGLAAAFAALALVYSVYLWGPTHGGGWFVPPDITMLLKAGSLVDHGHLSSAYGSSLRALYALPLSFPIMGLVDQATRLLGLPWAPYPDAIFIVTPACVALAVPVLQQGRRLASDLGMRGHLWVVQVVTAVVVVLPEFRWGHPEDALALACVVAALRRLIRADWVAAGLWLSAGVSFKQWALVLIPMFVLASPAGQRVRTALAACALPAALAALFIAVDPRHAPAELFSPITMVKGVPGHPSLVSFWLGYHTSQVDRDLVMVLAVVVTWLRRDRVGPWELIATATAVLAIRPLLETVYYPYYSSPVLLLVAVAGMAASRRLRVGDFLWPLLAVVWAMPVSNPSTNTEWWAGELLLLGLAARRVVPAFGGQRIFSAVTEVEPLSPELTPA